MIPDLSVLIVTHNSADMIGACLDSLGLTEGVSCELILVDNASTDATLAAIGRFPNVRLIANEENTGFAAAVNQAGKLAQGRYLLLLNPDTIVHENAVERLVAYMDSQPGTGICAPRVLTPEGVIRYNCFAFETPWSFFCFGVGLGPLNASLRKISRPVGWNIASDRPQKVDAVTGAAMMVRRSLFERLISLKLVNRYSE